jgi:hypothetical protein
MKCHTYVSSTSPTQLPHKFSYIVAILIHNHFESQSQNLVSGRVIHTIFPPTVFFLTKDNIFVEILGTG